MPNRTTRVLQRGAMLLAAALGPCACTSAPAPVWLPQGQGKLQKATDKVSTPSHRTSSAGGGGRGSYRDEDDGFFEALLGEIVGEAVVTTLGLPWWLPHQLMEDRSGEMASAFYLQHPYAVADKAFLGRAFGQDDSPRQAYSLRTALEYGSDFDGIERIGATARLETAVRLGLDASWSHYREDLPGAVVDTLNLGDVNLTYRFAQAGYGEMRTGLGLNWFADGAVDEYGFNFTYGGDFYLGKPWITSFELDLGTLGAATRFHGRATVGAEWGGCEFCAGFDYESLDAVALPSWTIGMRIWL